ncbi:MAG: PadR family transcriptional regulator [Bacillota bacterium]
MKKYNDTTYAVLGILTTECKTGYAIKQLIDNSLSHFWKISYGQIYPALKLIVQEELAEVRESASPGKRDKNEYYLTTKGKETLKRWLEEPIEQLPVERNEILLKLFFGQHQSKEKTHLLLLNYKHDLEKRYRTYITIEQSITAQHAHDQDAAYWLFTLDYGKRVTKAAVEWCDCTLDNFSQMGDQ